MRTMWVSGWARKAFRQPVQQNCNSWPSWMKVNFGPAAPKERWLTAQGPKGYLLILRSLVLNEVLYLHPPMTQRPVNQP